MKIRNPDFKPARDAASFIVGVLTGTGLIGFGIKKLFVSPDQGLGKRFMIGLAATIASGGPGLIPFLIATPGQPAKADVQNAQANVTQNRY